MLKTAVEFGTLAQIWNPPCLSIVDISRMLNDSKSGNQGDSCRAAALEFCKHGSDLFIELIVQADEKDRVGEACKCSPIEASCAAHRVPPDGEVDAQRPPAHEEGSSQDGHHLGHLHHHRVLPLVPHLEDDEGVNDHYDQGGDEEDKDGGAPDPGRALVRE